MSPNRKPSDTEGWESLAEESLEGALHPSRELEEALAEAAAAVETDEEGPPRPAGPPRGDKELTDTRDQLLRLRADFDNFRKRALKEHQEAHQYGHQNLVKDLLSTVDNLERAIDHARTSGSGDLERLLQGVELVQRELMGALGKHGVTEIEALHKLFDPAVHEAMGQVSETLVAPNTVIEVLQKGYWIRDRLLRPARVIVSRAPEGGEDEGDES